MSVQKPVRYKNYYCRIIYREMVNNLEPSYHTRGLLFDTRINIHNTGLYNRYRGFKCQHYIVTEG